MATIQQDIWLSTTQQARRIGQADLNCIQRGGFVVARMSNGGFDYFPIGQQVQIAGQLDHGAKVVEIWSWADSWRRVYPI